MTTGAGPRVEQRPQAIPGCRGRGSHDPVFVEEGITHYVGSPIDSSNVGQWHAKGIGPFLEDGSGPTALKIGDAMVSVQALSNEGK